MRIIAMNLNHVLLVHIDRVKFRKFDNVIMYEYGAHFRWY